MLDVRYKTLQENWSNVKKSRKLNCNKIKARINKRVETIPPDSFTPMMGMPSLSVINMCCTPCVLSNNFCNDFVISIAKFLNYDKFCTKNIQQRKKNSAVQLKRSYAINDYSRSRVFACLIAFHDLLWCWVILYSFLFSKWSTIKF